MISVIAGRQRGVGPPGPAVSGTFVNVDFGAATGQTVAKTVWGVSTDFLSDPALLTNATVQSIFSGLAYPLIRFNSTSQWAEQAFPSGAITSSTLATFFGPLINNWSKLFPADCRIIVGLGNGPNNWSTSARFATMCGVVANYFHTTNGTTTGAPCPVYGFEIGNEDNDPSTGAAPSFYNSYFNAASVAIKAVSSSYKMFGPVFSFVAGVSAFTTGCAGHYDALDYHWYEYGTQTEFDASKGSGGVGGIVGFLTGTSLGFDYAFGGAVADAISSTTPIFIGEYNGNNTYGTLTADGTGNDSPGICNTYMCDYHGAVFVANSILSGLDATNNFQMAGIWEAYQDSDYGMVGATDVPGGGNTISPAGYLLSKAASTIYGARATAAVGSASPVLKLVAVSGGPGATNFAVMLINYSTTTSYTGQVALSRWPVNKSGSGSIHQWLVNSSNTAGTVTTVTVTGGLTASITVPAISVMILYA